MNEQLTKLPFPNLTTRSRWSLLWLVPASALASIALFLMLAQLTSPAKVDLGRKFDSPELEFLLVRKESELEVLSRERLPEPEVTMDLDTPELDPVVNDALNFDQVALEVAAPDIALSVNIDMSPSLANLNSLDVGAQMFATGLPFQANPRALKDVPPRYPSRAQRKRIEGHVKAEFMIDAEGYVKTDSIKILESVPPGVFDNSVKRSLKRSRFESFLVNGEAVSFRAQKSFHYQMPK